MAEKCTGFCPRHTTHTTLHATRHTNIDRRCYNVVLITPQTTRNGLQIYILAWLAWLGSARVFLSWAKGGRFFSPGPKGA